MVYAFLRGASPEAIVRSFPLLTLEQVYGSITYFLAHEHEVEEYLRQGEAEFETLRRTLRAQLRRAKPELYARLETARRQGETSVR